MKRATLFFIATLFVFSLNAQENSPTEALTVFMVRHAEKIDNSRDPDLSEEGRKRAKELAEVLASARIGTIYSTEYVRTRETALPTAQKFELEVQMYDPKDLDAFAGQLKKEGGRHLVVGHSNTTPELVKLLGGDPGASIVEKNEYDRLYILSESANGNMETVLIRYGKKFNAKE